jgi:hypothetical protein
MGFVKDITRAVGEARRATKVLLELADLKKRLETMAEERDRERRRRQELEAAIRQHKKAMEDCPRSWESDQELWRLVEP